LDFGVNLQPSLIKSKLFHELPNLDAELPKELAYPFLYQPDPLARKAAHLLQKVIEEKLPFLNGEEKGRMFGVLVVENDKDELGYIAAYSGELQKQLEVLPFVPPVYQLPKGDDFAEMAGINAISKNIKTILDSVEYKQSKIQAEDSRKRIEQEIEQERLRLKLRKKARKDQRKTLSTLSDEERNIQLNQLAKESQDDGYAIKRFVRAKNAELAQVQEQFKAYQKEISALKVERKSRSAQLQEEIFEKYIFFNAHGETKNVKQVFEDAEINVPPAGAGECAAPKLFQYAFQHKLEPIALAEFWWGSAPESRVRKHKEFYPACRRKCKPILTFMLQGLKVASNQLLTNYGEGKQIETIFEDEYLCVINKPEGLLSVPGKTIQDSVYQRMADKYPKATGPIVVHRLDQDTSGLMLIAKDKDTHKHLQEQFQQREIQKEYVALLDGLVEKEGGTIELPLRVDFDNRPMQLVDFKHGKKAITHFKVLQQKKGRTLINLKPITGRSHQLRVHCAHHLGLGVPMVGDNLYGHPNRRLCLHAEKIEFTHPSLNRKMQFEVAYTF
jgi:tRNA pseudouridine32 synthase/23S rRNA pseudouridine746 synthase